MKARMIGTDSVLIKFDKDTDSVALVTSAIWAEFMAPVECKGAEGNRNMLLSLREALWEARRLAENW